MTTMTSTPAELVAAFQACADRIEYSGSVERARYGRVVRLEVEANGRGLFAVVRQGLRDDYILRGARAESFRICGPVDGDWEAQLLS